MLSSSLIMLASPFMYEEKRCSTARREEGQREEHVGICLRCWWFCWNPLDFLESPQFEALWTKFSFSLCEPSISNTKRNTILLERDTRVKGKNHDGIHSKYWWFCWRPRACLVSATIMTIHSAMLPKFLNRCDTTHPFRSRVITCDPAQPGTKRGAVRVQHIFSLVAP